MKAALVTLLFAGHAFASDETWGLTWRAPEGCMQAAELAERLEKRIGRPLFAAQAKRSIDGYLASDAAGFRARLTLVDAFGKVLGTRELEQAADTCRALDDRVVLMLAMLIQPLLESPEPAPPPPAPPPLEPQPSFIRPPPRRPELAVKDGVHLVDGRPVEVLGFYQALRRSDLSEAFWERSSLKSLGIAGAVVLALTSAGLFLASALNADCTRWTGTPLLPGVCSAKHSGLMVSGAIVAGVALVPLIWALVFPAAPTSLDEDAALAERHNRPALGP